MMFTYNSLNAVHPTYQLEPSDVMFPPQLVLECRNGRQSVVRVHGHVHQAVEGTAEPRWKHKAHLKCDFIIEQFIYLHSQYLCHKSRLTMMQKTEKAPIHSLMGTNKLTIYRWLLHHQSLKLTLSTTSQISQNCEDQ